MQISPITGAPQWLKAKLEKPCAECSVLIRVGDRTFPQEAEDGSIVYIHLSCAKRAQLFAGQPLVEAPVCKHWRARGLCLYAERCIFRHPTEESGRSALLDGASTPCSGSDGSGGSGSPADGATAAAFAKGVIAAKRQRSKVKNKFRAGAFRRWLIDVYGRDRLRQGAGVLDVAAGKGELAFELLNLNNIPATVLEPRPLDLRKRAKWLQCGFFHWNAEFLAYNDRPYISTSAHQQQQPQQQQQRDGEREKTAYLVQLADRGNHSAEVLLPPHLRLVVTPQLSTCLVASSSSSSSNADDKHTTSSLCEGSNCSMPATTCAMPAEWPGLFEHARREARQSKWASSATGHEPEDTASARCTAWQDEAGCGAAAEAATEPAAVPASLPSELAPGLRATAVAPWQDTAADCAGAVGVHTLAADLGDMRLDGGGDEEREAAVNEVVDAVDAWQRLTCCSIVVGMHPDQATDFIVDLALAAGKPFAVVPCCVHARLFPRRRVQGRPVYTYDDLVAYIVAKDPANIRVANLPFEGRNCVVYRLP